MDELYFSEDEIDQINMIKEMRDIIFSEEYDEVDFNLAEDYTVTKTLNKFAGMNDKQARSNAAKTAMTWKKVHDRDHSNPYRYDVNTHMKALNRLNKLELRRPHGPNFDGMTGAPKNKYAKKLLKARYIANNGWKK